MLSRGEHCCKRMSETQKFSISKTTEERLPSLPFAKAKNSILGSQYELGLIFIGNKRSKTLNLTYRKKDKVANVLSFPLSQLEGEIYICLKEARRDAKLFQKELPEFVLMLFIHGMLHLKGYTHGSTMKRKEESSLQFFRKQRGKK